MTRELLKRVPANTLSSKPDWALAILVAAFLVTSTVIALFGDGGLQVFAIVTLAVFSGILYVAVVAFIRLKNVFAGEGIRAAALWKINAGLASDLAQMLGNVIDEVEKSDPVRAMMLSSDVSAVTRLYSTRIQEVQGGSE